jgi:hypothetical protein
MWDVDILFEKTFTHHGRNVCMGKNEEECQSGKKRTLVISLGMYII